MLVVVLSAACNDGAAPRRGSADTTSAIALSTRVDSAGRYPSTVVSGEPPVGAIDSVFAVRDRFVSLRTVLLDPAGGVWTLDEGARQVVRYTDDGERATAISSTGSGDGQFATPYSMAWGGGDLMIFDPGNSRVGRWKPDGTWAGSWRAVPITGGANARFFPTGSSSSAWLFQFSFLSTGQPAPGFARYPLTPRGDVRWIPPTVRGSIPNIVQCVVGSGQRTFQAPFTLGETWLPALGRDLLYVQGVDYLIATVDSAGDTLQTVRRDVAQAAVTDAEWNVASAELEQFRAANPGSCNGTFTRPAAKAAVRAMTFDDRGRLWVERVVADGFLWEIWEGDALVGAIPGIARDPAVPVDIRGDRIAVAASGADGQVEVRVYRFTTSR